MKQKFKETWSSINTASKALTVLAFIALIHVVLTIFLDSDQSSPADISIRSIMSSIFGFLFGTQVTENSNLMNKKIQTALAAIVATICMVVTIFSHWYNVYQTSAAPVEIRNLMFSAIGFLLSRAKQTD